MQHRQEEKIYGELNNKVHGGGGIYFDNKNMVLTVFDCFVQDASNKLETI
jgi:hypothetical protein